MDKEKVTEALNNIYKDLLMLESGEWIPDEDSCGCTIDNIQLIAKELDIELKETEE